MLQEQTHVAYSVPVVEFITVANEYCKLLEDAGRLERKDFLVVSQRLLPLLYLKATLLPTLEGSDGMVEKFVSEGDWEMIRRGAEQKLGSADVYVEVLEKMHSADETTSVLLSECFADMYQDLKDVCTSFRLGNEDAAVESIADCKLNFEEYWGGRLLQVLNELHRLLYGNEYFDDDDTDMGQDSFDNDGLQDWMN